MHVPEKHNKYKYSIYIEKVFDEAETLNREYNPDYTVQQIAVANFLLIKNMKKALDHLELVTEELLNIKD